MKRVLTFISIILNIFYCWAQIPQGYYNSANGLSGEDLREELYQIIKNHNSQSYDALWSHFEETDKKQNGSVWDMYSDNPTGVSSYEYTFVADQCGNYNQEGVCYNREHSFPQSWFSDASPMKSDLFHVYPTDGWVNGKRGNYPYGNVSSASWTSINGSKLGTGNNNGYNGTVFEPIDEYKGDFARTYFYMVTRYKDIANNWSSDMLSGDDLSDWALNVLLEWDKNDTVSQKEIDRNNAIYKIQNNRNPYIDNPKYVDYIWRGQQPVVNNINTKLNDDFSINYNNEKLNVACVSCSQLNINIFNVMGENIYSTRVNKQSWDNNISLRNGVYITVVNGFSKKIAVF